MNEAADVLCEEALRGRGEEPARVEAWDLAQPRHRAGRWGARGSELAAKVEYLRLVVARRALETSKDTLRASTAGYDLVRRGMGMKDGEVGVLMQAAGDRCKLLAARKAWAGKEDQAGSLGDWMEWEKGDRQGTRRMCPCGMGAQTRWHVLTRCTLQAVANAREEAADLMQAAVKEVEHGEGMQNREWRECIACLQGRRGHKEGSPQAKEVEETALGKLQSSSSMALAKARRAARYLRPVARMFSAGRRTRAGSSGRRT